MGLKPNETAYIDPCHNFGTSKPTAPWIPKYDRADYPYTVTSYYTQQRYSTPTDCKPSYDHIVSLHDAHNSGAYDFTPEQKKQFANDPLNIVVSCLHVNKDKKTQITI